MPKTIEFGVSSYDLIAKETNKVMEPSGMMKEIRRAQMKEILMHNRDSATKHI